MGSAETKTAAYWTVAFTKLCIGMKDRGALKWLHISYTASSLHQLIASGSYSGTNIGKNNWKYLISGSSLQSHCDKEGFNVQYSLKVRIGIVANNENNCLSTDSFLGFGSSYNSVTCGNFARHGGDNGDKTLPVFGYIFVQ